MSACIVCGKSAGLWYSLHKDCYQQYQDILSTLPAMVLENLLVHSPQQVQQQVIAVLTERDWPRRCQQDLLLRSMQISAQQLLCVPEKNQGRAGKLIELFTLCEANHAEPGIKNLLQRLHNLPAIEQFILTEKWPLNEELQSKFPDRLQYNEQVLWQFPRAKSGIRTPETFDAPSSSLGRLMDMMTLKRHPQPVKTNWLGESEFWLTTQRLQSFYNDNVEIVWLKNIDSLTPLKEGVRIQQTHQDSMAKDYICGDGRLMFLLIDRAIKQLAVK